MRTASRRAGTNKPTRIPLNDDAQEKAKRLQSRHASYSIQMNQIKAAASPMRRQSVLPNNDSPSAPKTPLRRGPAGKENIMLDDDINVGGSAVTPMKRVPILANFEEWMKMATDNKINAANSWNFALIDYFHDMSLLKEGNGVNFQRASVTLDGCVKIYTSRVDSVATETGKLLSGLAESKENKKNKNKEGEEGGAEESGDEEEVDEDGTLRKKPKRKAGRSSENTLAPSFASLQLKKMELEFSVDPLFKKASADFDEGGAKGLLLNHLSIDAQGRIVFDSSDDAGDASAEGAQRTRKDAATQDDEEPDASIVDQTQVEDELDDGEDADIDISALGMKFFPSLDNLEEMHICPTLKDFDMGDASGTTDIPFLKAKEQDTTADDNVNAFDDDAPQGYDDDDDDVGFGGNFEGEAIAGFGEGGEVWAREAAIEPQMRLHTLDEDNPENEDGAGAFDPESGEFIVKLQEKSGKATEGTHEDILSYFDTALQKNWAGPEHWRIRKIKNSEAKDAAPKPRKEKEPFEINFSAEMDAKTNDMLYTTATTNAAISLPKKDWKSKTRNLLPDDKHFSSKQLLRLFLKPKAQIGSRRQAKTVFGQQQSGDVPEGEMDEAFWAQKENPISSQVEEVKGDYDANFFQDDGLPMGGMDDDEDDFVDARDHLSPTPGGDNMINNIINGAAPLNGEFPEGPFGSQLVTQSRRLRPEYVQYARVAKKVDVRRLKEELWRGMEVKGLHSVRLTTHLPPNLPLTATQENYNNPAKSSQKDIPEKEPSDEAPLLFTELMRDLRNVYPKPQMNDISTSFCFICLLHLANEKGLVIENTDGFGELNVRRDETAVIAVGGE